MLATTLRINYCEMRCTRVKVHFSTTVGEGPEVEVGLVQSLRAGIHSKPQK
jgi:hypothetical protein